MFLHSKWGGVEVAEVDDLAITATMARGDPVVKTNEVARLWGNRLRLASHIRTRGTEVEQKTALSLTARPR